MYAGADKLEDGTIRGWREPESLANAITNHTFMIKQDVKLLNKEVITFAVERALAKLVVKHNLSAEAIDWFLPHYSSAYFRDDLRNRMEKIGLPIPTDRWFTNLATKGNTGAASIYIILEELFHSGRLKKGKSSSVSSLKVVASPCAICCLPSVSIGDYRLSPVSIERLKWSASTAPSNV